MSFKISVPKNTAFSGDHMGLTFTHGEAHTDDSFLASRLQSKGYVVANHVGVGGEAVSDQGEASEAPQGDSPESELYEKTVQQLKEYAAENGVDLSGARTKAEILAAINAAEADKEVQ